MTIDPGSLPAFTIAPPRSSTTADALFIAAHASVESNRLFTSGAFFDHIGLQGENPRVQVTIVAVVRTERSKWGKSQSLRFSLVSTDGRDNNLKLAEGEFSTNEGGPSDHDTVLSTLVIPVNFAATAGHFDLVLQIDGSEIRKLPLHLVAQS